MGERAGAQRRFGGSTVGAAEDSPLHSSNPPQIDPLAPGRDGCHAVAVWSSSAPTTSRTTGFSPDDMAQPRPLTAKAAAGMATSWRPERQHLNRGQRPDTLSTIGPIARFPIGVPDPVIRCRSGVTCPSPPGQRSPSRLCATRCKRSNGHWRPGSSLRRQQPMTARVTCCRSTPRAGFVPGPGAQLFSQISRGSPARRVAGSGCRWPAHRPGCRLAGDGRVQQPARRDDQHLPTPPSSSSGPGASRGSSRPGRRSSKPWRPGRLWPSPSVRRNLTASAKRPHNYRIRLEVQAADANLNGLRKRGIVLENHDAAAPTVSMWATWTIFSMSCA